MAEWNEALPEWNAAGAAPPQSKKDDGWQEGDKPPAQWHNWWMNTTYVALQEVRSVIDNLSASDVGAETPQGAQDKADAAEQNANDYTDQQVSNIDVPVDSVNGQTGEVMLDKGDVGLANVMNNQQATKTEFDSHATDTSNPHDTTKSDVGLANVTNDEQATKTEFNSHSSNNKKHVTDKVDMGDGYEIVANKNLGVMEFWVGGA